MLESGFRLEVTVSCRLLNRFRNSQSISRHRDGGILLLLMLERSFFKNVKID